MMSSAQKQQANVDIFDAYFRRADLDCDGRISGAEAVAFFQGSALPKHVLAQIWAHADQRQSGFLGRAEFYNALKLVTVAQSKRELTPEIVKAALYGPAAAKIPPPQINLNLVPAPQANSSLVAPVTQNHTVTSALPQNFGVTPVSASLRPQSIHTQDKNLVRPPLPTSSSSSHLTHGVATQGHPRGPTLAGSRPPNSSLTSDWMGGASGRPPVATSSPAQNNVTSLSMGQDGIGLARSGPTTSLPPIPQPAFGMSPSGLQANNSKPQKVSGNGFASGLDFGGDVFSVTPSQPKQDAPSHASSSTNVSASSAVASISDGVQPSVRRTALGSLQSSLMTQVSVGQFHSFGKQNQPVSPDVVATSSAPGTVPIVESSSRQSEMLWPKMTQNSVQKYTKVFVEVDTDRDGKITGEQARNLFLSWRLPREVLKQVWDLSDQDNDSMLSLREFCLALYLMERYREGRPLSAAISSEIMIHLSSMIPSNINYSTIGNTARRPSAGFPQQRGMPGPAAQLMTHAASPRPPRPPTSVPVPQTERPMNEKPKPKVPVLEKHLVDQLSTEEQSSLNSKFKEATEADKKVEELEKDIVESKQKIEFFRAKMQELILYKSRCDSRLNEIIERASADKREVESLAKKYEEKYKQSGDVASKLSIEEATFRDIQEKKMELYKELVKIDQNGTAGGDFQVDAVRIQSDLDEIVKSLNYRCKKYGLRTKPTTLLELPFGWQAGIQEGAVDWDEDWDKFEDEGLTFVKELTVNVQNVLAPPRQKMKLAKEEEPSPVESPTVVSSPSAIAKLDKLHRSDEGDVENGSVKSAPNSPFASSSIGSPSGEFSNLGKNIGYDASPRDKDTQSDQWGTGSSFTGDKSFDEPAWGTFDNNDDIDSVWGFNAATSTKDVEHKRKNSDNYFGSDFSLNPIRVGSPQAGGISQSRPFRFDDSVPGTPLYNLSNSPRMSRMGSEPAFDSFSRFDSFSMHDGFSPNNTMARFDSMRSTKDFDPSHGFPSFDDSDPFGSSGPFRTSLDSQTPRNTSDRWNAF